jgi:TRAP-type mannitol/chloroaromatic compound transport system permease large subunit
VKPDDVTLSYGVAFMVNMQMAFLSPPFGYSFFYLKSVAPPQITTAKAAVNFMVLQWIGGALWLPGIIYAGR